MPSLGNERFGVQDPLIRYAKDVGWTVLSRDEVLARHPTRLVRAAVTGMLPRNRLGRRLATKLKIYAGPEHPHRAQKPVPLPENAIRIVYNTILAALA